MHEPSYSAVFDHGRDPILIQRINKRVLTAFFTTLSFHLFVHPSFSLFVLVQYTHRHGPDASLPGRACCFGHRLIVLPIKIDVKEKIL